MAEADLLYIAGRGGPWLSAGRLYPGEEGNLVGWQYS